MSAKDLNRKGATMIKNSSGPGKRTNKSGFTLIEVIAVLVLIGIVSAFVAVRATDHHSELVARTEILKSHLRYAQMKSMSSNDVWGIHSFQNKYWLFTGGNINTKKQLPGEDDLDVDLAGYGLSVSDFTYSFENWGSPCTDAGATVRLTAAAPINVSEGLELRAINITPYTGFIL
ncbi:MAG: type II secretion system protein [Deltaproteobacteria bacterium]|nr:type II secretion system protein [Deltaproteobacteria bacterium]